MREVHGVKGSPQWIPCYAYMFIAAPLLLASPVLQQVRSGVGCMEMMINGIWDDLVVKGQHNGVVSCAWRCLGSCVISVMVTSFCPELVQVVMLWSCRGGSVQG